MIGGAPPEETPGRETFPAFCVGAVGNESIDESGDCRAVSEARGSLISSTPLLRRKDSVYYSPWPIVFQKDGNRPMLIKRLEVKGFKSLRDVVWEPGPLTVLIGPNGSGKTNLLLVVELLKHSACGKLEDFIQEFGGIQNILWDSTSTDIDILVTLLNEIHHSPSPDFYGMFISPFGFGPRFRIKHELYKETVPSTLPDQTIEKKLLDRDKAIARITTGDGLISLDENAFSQSESLLSLAVNQYTYDDCLYFWRLDLLNSRIFRNINIADDSIIRRPSITRYSRELHSNGQNLVNVLHTLYSEDRNFENDINTAMRAAFGDDFDRLVFPPAADQLVQLRIRWKSLKREQSMADLSDGTIRFLFLMTVLCNPDPAPLIAIDEPETGLHPSMFPIIAEYAAEASKRTQVIFSTHSPQFLDAFSEFDVTTTVTAWKDGETKIKNLDGETLKKWLEHYSLGSLFLSGDLEALA